jgi:hypothetical protein
MRAFEAGGGLPGSELPPITVIPGQILCSTFYGQSWQPTARERATVLPDPPSTGDETIPDMAF